MKRTLSLMLALVMAVSLMACGKKDDGKNNADAPADSLALLTKVWDSYTDDEKFPAAGGDYETSVDDAPGAFAPSNADNLNFLLTVPTEDASLIDDAASLMHMMNANTFTCGALRVKNGDDAAKLAEGTCATPSRTSSGCAASPTSWSSPRWAIMSSPSTVTRSW